MRIEKERQELILIFMSSFLLGIFYMNFAAEKYVTVTGIFYEGFLSQYTQGTFLTMDYLFYLAKTRTIPLLILSAGATTRYRKLVSILFLGWTGFSGGVLAVTSVLRMGGAGMLLCITALFPQALFYVMEYFMIIWYSYKYPEISWNNWKTCFVIIMHFAGVMTEGYLNPQILQILVRSFL